MDNHGTERAGAAILGGPTGLFVVAERYVRIEASPEDPDVADGDFAGLWVEVRSSLTNAERAALLEHLQETDAAIEEIRARYQPALREVQEQSVAAQAERRAADLMDCFQRSDQLWREAAREIQRIERRRIALLAPYIRAWNLPAPPPAEAGPAAFDALPAPADAWLRRVVLNAYREGKGLGSWRKPLPGSHGPTSASSTTTPGDSEMGSP